MCDGRTPLQRFIAIIAGGSTSGAAKASPGIAATGLVFFDYNVETWISILTLICLSVMIFGSLPKIFEALRYFWALRA